MESKENKKCYLCGSGKIIETDFKLRDSGDLKVLKCNNCKLEFLSSFNHIDNNFYADGKMIQNKVLPLNWQKASFKDDKRRCDFLKKTIENKSVLDFGCGAGGFLSLIGNFAEVRGLEPNLAFRDFFIENNLKVYQNIDEIKEKFDYITAFHVLEHLKNPKEEISGLKKLLKKGGKIILEIPNNNDALLTLYKCKKFSDFTHWKCHLFYFNEKTIRKLFLNTPFKIEKIKRVQRYNLANHIGWLFSGEPGGHNKYNIPRIINKIYETFLKAIAKTDTLVIFLSEKEC